MKIIFDQDVCCEQLFPFRRKNIGKANELSDDHLGKYP